MKTYSQWQGRKSSLPNSSRRAEHPLLNIQATLPSVTCMKKAPCSWRKGVIDEAMKGDYPYAIAVEIVHGCGNQTVASFFRQNPQVVNRPKFVAWSYTFVFDAVFSVSSSCMITSHLIEHVLRDILQWNELMRVVHFPSHFDVYLKHILARKSTTPGMLPGKETILFSKKSSCWLLWTSAFPILQTAVWAFIFLSVVPHFPWFNSNCFNLESECIIIRDNAFMNTNKLLNAAWIASYYIMRESLSKYPMRLKYSPWFSPFILRTKAC